MVLDSGSGKERERERATGRTATHTCLGTWPNTHLRVGSPVSHHGACLQLTPNVGTSRRGRILNSRELLLLRGLASEKTPFFSSTDTSTREQYRRSTSAIGITMGICFKSDSRGRPERRCSVLGMGGKRKEETKKVKTRKPKNGRGGRGGLRCDGRRGWAAAPRGAINRTHLPNG